MQTDAFFRHEHGLFHPTDICRGPWDPNSLHGRVVAGLLAFEIEQKWGDPAFLPSRLTVDLYRMPPFAPVTVRSTAVRGGNRLKVIDAEFLSGETSIGRASCTLLRRGDQPEGEVWKPANWQVSPPDAFPPPEPVAGRTPMWEQRTIDHGFGAVAQKRTWLRETRDLVEGQPLTPFLRAAVAADFTNPFANSGSQGLQFVNADITLYLHRLPEGEWLGFEVTSHQSFEGIATGVCGLYDTAGAIGSSSVCGLAQRRTAQMPPLPKS